MGKMDSDYKHGFWEIFFFFGKRNRKAEGLPDEDEVYLFSKMRDITASSFA